jgi:hypothetical protein
VSYPAYRIQRLEDRLLYICNSKERKRIYAELSFLKKVIQEDRSFCTECVFDCLQCRWIAAAFAQSD